MYECSGYMSPEYAMEGIFSEKSDVFSFGVLVLEILSGRKNSSFFHADQPLNLIGYVSLLHRVCFKTIFIQHMCAYMVFKFNFFRHGSYGKKVTC